MRVPRFDPRSGLTRLDTIRVTQDAADQRRGRAGRLESRYPLSALDQRRTSGLLPRRPPEILEADLAPLALDLAEWGVIDATGIVLARSAACRALAQARELLRQLGRT